MISANPGLDLAVQDGVLAALSADAGLTALVPASRIFDAVPDRKSLRGLPYITIGDDDITDDTTTCIESSDILATVHVWSRAPGKVEAKRIGGYVRRALAREIAIAGHDTVAGFFETAVYRPGEDPSETEGVLVFRYLVDPLEA